jgi:hypothetical protein
MFMVERFVRICSVTGANCYHSSCSFVADLLIKWVRKANGGRSA